MKTTTRKRTKLKTTVRLIAFVAGFGGFGIIYITALLLDVGFGMDVRITQPHDSTVVEVNRSLFIPGDPVADIYGNTMIEPVRVILPNTDRIIRPVEDPSLVLLQVDKLQGENPLQSKTIWLFVKVALIPLLLLGVGGLFLPPAHETLFSNHF